MSGAGKGDTYRKVDKIKFDASYDRIFGKRDEQDSQKSQKSTQNTTTPQNNK